MIALRINNATRVLSEGQSEYTNLAILDREIDGQNFMTSLWEPTPAELHELNNGGAVRLTIMGDLHPPVIIQTQPPPPWEEPR